MYVLEDFYFETFTDSLGATGVHRSLSLCIFVDVQTRRALGDAFKLVTFGAGAKIATRLKKNK